MDTTRGLLESMLRKDAVVVKDMGCSCFIEIFQIGSDNSINTMTRAVMEGAKELVVGTLNPRVLSE
jgi:hypothetical protein